MRRVLPATAVLALFLLPSCGGGGGGDDGAQFKGGASGALPAAPYGLSAEAVAGRTVQVVTWNDNSSIVTFRMALNWPDVNFSYPFGSFLHRNGPAFWPVITYVGQ